ncbi:MAG: glycosyltransferase family 2 protein [Candidatus Nealsonbacteria bacterium]|nr:glycosyltransferase family 2 protein [Candidatus Nealsonbacteria bacterium]
MNSTPKVSVIIPALNEVGSIGAVLNDIPKDRVDEILVADGGSTDGTVELVEKLGYIVVTQEKKGFGAAIASGIENAKGDVVMVINADGSMNPKDIPVLLDKLNEGYDLVLASRYLKGAGSEDDTFSHYIGNRIFTFLCNMLYGTKISDSLYFFLAAKKDIFKKINMSSVHAGYCIELPIKAHKAGFKIGEIPSFEKKRTAGKAKVHALSAGFKILLTLLKQ